MFGMIDLDIAAVSYVDISYLMCALVVMHNSFRCCKTSDGKK